MKRVWVGALCVSVFLRAHRTRKAAGPDEPAPGEGTPGTEGSAPAVPSKPSSDLEKP